MKKQTYISVLLFLCCCFSTHHIIAQDISLFQQFNGRFDYTAFGNTLNTVENGTTGPCLINTSSSATLTLAADQTMVAAYLYWAGSDDGDFDIELNGIPVTAERTFSDALTADRTFFAAFADVTAIVQAEGNGLYTVSEFDLTSVIAPYCPTGTNFGGWAITVIYENPSLPLNQLNVYDGLESVPEELEITLDNLNVFDNMGAKIGFIAWEGDQALSVNESLRVNGTIISNLPLNPADNAFNGTNSFTGASNLYNMDIDFYNIQNNISIGDTEATISLTSGQDFVMINNIITVLNSQLPDATVVIDEIDSECESRGLEITYTISNTNSTAVLAQNTSIALYTDGVLIATDVTQVALTIGGSTQQTIIVTIPTTIPNTFDLLIVVDDDGTSTGTVDEINEDNNSALQSFTLPTSPVIPILPALELCDNIESIVFDLTAQESFFSDPSFTFEYFETLLDALNNTDAITNPDSYSTTNYPAEIFIKVTNSITLCNSIGNFELILLESPEVMQPEDLEACKLDETESVTFDLTLNETNINTDSNLIFSYYETANSDGTFQDEIITPTAFDNTSNPQTIYVTIENLLGCISSTSFELIVDDCEIYIPNGFSPNNDGKNDVFNIVNLEAHPNHEIYIYNRYGILIFVGNKNTSRWDGYSNRGTPKNKKLPTGTYFYVLYLNDENTLASPLLLEQTYTGWVYLQNN
ncbi:gliding motility-associated C-terminal domain-containing protein [Kordia sp.]|uniref:gliding motility-associated C-terminal domain-containing protein n=1 Tax=Kordia sp. TaxID=1965332 RepID=UPI0025C401CA|nr:gliding motility-associated C-terminal domain-containing protein [Kordia sp.]MCH2193723.1 gliding motility-associated C-terminal domain-containing protein [Kordia sp.]